jgi:hypothetical protein
VQHKTLRSVESVYTVLVQVTRAVPCRAEAKATSWILKCVSWYLRTKGKVGEHFSCPISVISHPTDFFIYFNTWLMSSMSSRLFPIGSLAFFVIVVNTWNSACFPLLRHQSVPSVNAHSPYLTAPLKNKFTVLSTLATHYPSTHASTAFLPIWQR